MVIKKLGVSYLGSKLHQMNELLTYKREFSKGLDLFGGSAVVSLNFGLEYNDLSDYVINLMTICDSDIMDNYIKKYRVLENLEQSGKYLKMNQTYFNQLVDDYKKDSKNIYLTYIVSKVKVPMVDFERLSYCDRRDIYISIFNDSLAEKQDRWNRYIKKWHNMDFRNFDFNEYDFLFIDPPYLSSKHLYQGWSVCDEIDLLNSLRGYDGRFIITNMLNPYLEAFIEERGLYKYEFNTKRNSENGMLGGNSTKPKEYIITNYKAKLF